MAWWLRLPDHLPFLLTEGNQANYLTRMKIVGNRHIKPATEFYKFKKKTPKDCANLEIATILGILPE